MMKNFKNIIQILFLLSFPVAGIAQQYNLPFTHFNYNLWEQNLHKPGSGLHTSIKPFILANVEQEFVRNGEGDMDSIYATYYFSPEKSRKGFMRKLRHENLIYMEGEDYKLRIDPVLHVALGKDFNTGENLNMNSRGVMVAGDIGKKFSFFSTFIENQAAFPDYVDSVIRYTGVVPGQGQVRPFKGNTYDFANATGYISYSPNKIFNFQFGNDRNFIGDGYRSLLLSDNQFPYPFLKINTRIWKIHYQNLFTSLMDRRSGYIPDQGYTKKAMNMHYLSYQVHKRITIGLFESITWGSGVRGFEPSYYNPILFYHPIAFSDQSNANMLIAMNLKIVPVNNVVLYGQLMLDEFRFKDIVERNGWWGNKQGVQLGVKYFQVAGIKNLILQQEYNTVRPFTYQYSNSLTSYDHYNQALAHPVGANFKEHLTFLTYRYKMFSVQISYQYLRYGDDSIGVNNGRRVENNYMQRTKNYDYRTLDGVLNTIHATGFNFYYILNPKSATTLHAGYTMRSHLVQGHSTRVYPMLSVGIRTLLFNSYYDF